MPKFRSADYYLGCLDGSVFMDFNNHGSKLVSLKRISFDGYGCCNLSKKVLPIDEENSIAFKKMMNNQSINQEKLAPIIKNTIKTNLERCFS